MVATNYTGITSNPGSFGVLQAPETRRIDVVSNPSSDRMGTYMENGTSLGVQTTGKITNEGTIWISFSTSREVSVMKAWQVDEERTENKAKDAFKHGKSLHL